MPTYGNLIADPGFEAAGTGSWNFYTSTNAFSMDFDTTAEARSGSESLVVSWTSSVHPWQVAEANQNLAVSAGDPFTASAYAKITTALDNPCYAYLETIFYDAASAEVGAHLQSAKLHETNNWQQLSNLGTVPGGAVTARVRLVTFNEDGNSSGGTVYWDDVSAETIPEPFTALLFSAGLALVFCGRRRQS
jgi:hypothetical protein